MACAALSSLPFPMTIYCHLDPYEETSAKFELKHEDIENVVYKMVDIVFWPQCSDLVISGNYMIYPNDPRHNWIYSSELGDTITHHWLTLSVKLGHHCAYIYPRTQQCWAFSRTSAEAMKLWSTWRSSCDDVHWQQDKFAFILDNFDNVFLRWRNHDFIK